jgi:hypothetical protein
MTSFTRTQHVVGWTAALGVQRVRFDNNCTGVGATIGAAKCLGKNVPWLTEINATGDAALAFRLHARLARLATRRVAHLRNNVSHSPSCRCAAAPAISAIRNPDDQCRRPWIDDQGKCFRGLGVKNREKNRKAPGARNRGPFANSQPTRGSSDE